MPGLGHDSSGFSVFFADNVDYTGAAFPTATVLLNGQLLIGSTALPHIQVGSITSPSGSVTVGYNAPNLTLDVAAAALVWSIIAINTAGVTNHGYIANAASTIQLTLPPASAIGDEFIILRNLNGAGLWQIKQAAGQQILLANSATTVGVAGSVTATNKGDVLTLRCIAANTTWAEESSVGNLTVA